MNFNKLIILFALYGVSSSQVAYSQTTGAPALSFDDFTYVSGSEKSWEQVADINFSSTTAGKAKKAAGNGVILYNANAQGGGLVTKETLGDAEVEFDYLVDKGASFGMLLGGRYRVNLSDSWNVLNPAATDMGGIGPLKQNAGTFTSLVPLTNAAKAPGLWQHVRVRFRSPQFSGSNKTANALFESIYINGVLVQDNAEVQAISAGSMYESEAATGPLLFIGGNGQAAVRNVKITKLAPIVNQVVATGRRMRRVANPILLNPERKNYLLRSFVNFNGKKRTHVVSLGNPLQVNYSYDVKQGALFQIWHGQFVDVTEMWEQRGEPQLAKPLGSVIALSEAPALAVLSNKDATLWPDSVAFYDQKNMGYTLDKQRNPTFEYETGGYHVADKLTIIDNNKSILRQLTVTKAPANLYCRIAVGSSIKQLENGVYIVGDKSFYVQIDEKLKPWIRFSKNQSELLVPVTENMPLTYSLIW